MIVNVTASVRLRYEGGCWTLENKIVVGAEGQKKGRKPKEENIGAERWASVGYYGTIDQAVNQLLFRHMDLLDAPAEMSLSELDVTIRKMARMLREIYKDIPNPKPVEEPA